MKKIFASLFLLLFTTATFAVPVTYKIEGDATIGVIGATEIFQVSGWMVIDDTAVGVGGRNVTFYMNSFDINISNGTTNYSMTAPDGHLTWFKPSETDTEWFADGWFINTDYGTIYDMSQLPYPMLVGSEILPDELGFGLNGPLFTSDPIAFEPDAELRALNFTAVAVAASVPEPASLSLLGLGLAFLGWKKRKAHQA